MRTLIANVFVYVSDAAETMVHDGAILIEDSRIVEVGAGDALAGRFVDRVIDAHGMVALPGFINCHAHATLSANRADSDDLELFPWLLDGARVRTPHPDDAVYSAYLGAFEMVRGGITYVVECGRREPYLYAKIAREIGQRCLSGAMANSEELRPGAGNWPVIVQDTERAMAQAPQDDTLMTRYFLGAHSPYSCTPGLLRKVKQEADRLGLLFDIHLAECQDEMDIIQQRHGTTPLRLAHDLGLLDRRTILNHAVWISEDEIPILAASGASVAHCPISNGKLASGVAPVTRFRAQGVPVGLGTDSTVSNNTLNIWEEMKVSLLLQRATSHNARQLTARDALAMATREAARVVGLEDDLGSLEVGKRADIQLVALEHPRGLTPARVRSDLVWATRPEQVQLVMVNGEVVYEDGAFTRVDEPGIQAAARAHFARRERGET
ncbi:MAG: amidohydrolase [Chloroflexi bacterium]|nr:amidohydrolase [Chloroflexota bacterium]